MTIRKISLCKDLYWKTRDRGSHNIVTFHIITIGKVFCLLVIGKFSNFGCGFVFVGIFLPPKRKNILGNYSWETRAAPSCTGPSITIPFYSPPMYAKASDLLWSQYTPFPNRQRLNKFGWHQSRSAVPPFSLVLMETVPRKPFFGPFLVHEILSMVFTIRDFVWFSNSFLLLMVSRSNIREWVLEHLRI